MTVAGTLPIFLSQRLYSLDNTATKIQIPQKAGHLTTSWATIRRCGL